MLKVYDTENDSWDLVPGSSFPKNLHLPLLINCWDSKIYVVGLNLRVVVGQMSRIVEASSSASTSKSTFFVQWNIVNEPLLTFDELRPMSAEVLLI